MTVLLGPVPCARCGAPVTVVRRPIVVWCSPECRACAAQKGTKHRHGAVTSVLEVVTLGDDLSVHSCVEPNARSASSGYTDTVGISDAPSRILCDALPVADTSREGVSRPEVSAL